MAEFPCTLRDICPEGGLAHVLAEYRGKRFYLGSSERIADAKQLAASYSAPPGCGLYVRDRSDSTSIDGAMIEFEAECRKI